MERVHRHTPRGRRRSLLALVALTTMVAVLTAGAGTAAAHSGAADATNYVSEIVDPGDAGLLWTVYGGDSLLELTNATGEQVEVEGYEKEPYLRFVPGEGVFENIHSPAVYFNTNRYANTVLPDAADASLPPEWRQVASGDSYAWHDHRAHWMSPVPPSPVFNDPEVAQKVLDWQIPVHIGDGSDARTVTVEGLLRWEPPVPWWPPVLAWSVVFGAIALVAALRTAPQGDRWTGLARAVVLVIWAVTAATVVRVVDDIVAVPTSTGERVGLAVGAAVTIVVVVLLTLHAWRGSLTGYLALTAAALIDVVLFGIDHSIVLSGSQVVSSLPYWMARWTVAANMALVVPAAIAAVFAGRYFAGWYREHPITLRRPEQPAPEPTST